MDKTLNTALSALFQRHDPELELIDYQSNHTARFRLLDCDGYLVGEMICEEVFVWCLSTGGCAYSGISIFKKHEIPERFSWIRKWFEETTPDDFHLIELIPVFEDEYQEFFLPPLEGRPTGYIVCRSLQLLPR